MKILVGLILFFSTMGLVAVIGGSLESKGFNKGICPRCKNKLRYFGTDSQGGNGYTCVCGYTTWVSWWFVDKNYKEQL